MQGAGRYVYGIIEDQGEQQLSLAGIGGGTVETIRHRDLAAVVSAVPVQSYDRFDDRLLSSSLRTHHVVLENVMRDHAVIPMGFGMIARNADEVGRLLESAYSDFKDALRQVAHRIELNVQMTCNETQAISELANESYLIRTLVRDSLPTAAGDSVSTRARIGQAIAEALHEMVRTCRENVMLTLDAVAVSSCPGKLTGPHMILNESFLVEREREPEFDESVNGLARTHEGRFSFKYIGPMPPYSFVNLVATVLDAKTVLRARGVLGVGEQVTMGQLTAAYRRLARRYHPDRNGGDPENAARFAEATQAFETLSKCIRRLRPNADSTYSLRAEEISGSILIEARR